MKIVRRILSVIAGLLSGLVVIFLIEKLAHKFHPLPEGFDMKDKEAMIAHAKSAPLNALLVVAAGWALAAFVAGIVSTLVAGDRKNTYALICAVVFMILTVMNLVWIPSPIWLWIVGIGAWIPLALAGHAITLKIFKQ